MNIIKNLIKSLFYGVFICLIQISILNYTIFYIDYLYIYIIFIIYYPFSWNKYMFLFLSFLIGEFVDCCMNTGGIHAFSTILVAFFRLKFLLFIDGNYFLTKKNFSIYNMSFIKNIFYILSIVITHNMSLYIFEILKESINLNKFSFIKIILSCMLTSFLCIVYFFFRRIKI